MTVTGSERNLVTELAGRSPVERVKEVFESAPVEDQELMRHGLLVGCVIDEHKVEPEVGDFLVRTVVGADPESGAIALGDLVKVGQTIQFHVRDEASADQDLHDGLKRLRDRLPDDPSGALLFTCNGRGSNLFSEPDHDAKAVAHELEGLPLAGFFAGGEIGPIGNRNFLHGFTASIAIVGVKASS
jgi:small ligand-binding sensory domain FIST